MYVRDGGGFGAGRARRNTLVTSDLTARTHPKSPKSDKILDRHGSLSHFYPLPCFLSLPPFRPPRRSSAPHRRSPTSPSSARFQSEKSSVTATLRRIVATFPASISAAYGPSVALLQSLMASPNVRLDDLWVPLTQRSRIFAHRLYCPRCTPPSCRRREQTDAWDRLKLGPMNTVGTG